MILLCLLLLTDCGAKPISGTPEEQVTCTDILETPENHFVCDMLKELGTYNIAEAVPVLLDGGQMAFSGTKEECLEQEIMEKTFGLKRYTVEGMIFFSAK